VYRVSVKAGEWWLARLSWRRLVPRLRWREAKVWRKAWKPAPRDAGLLDEGLEDEGRRLLMVERAAGVVGEEDCRGVLIGTWRRCRPIASLDPQAGSRQELQEQPVTGPSR
jgi:hypothetical protein